MYSVALRAANEKADILGQILCIVISGKDKLIIHHCIEKYVAKYIVKKQQDIMRHDS